MSLVDEVLAIEVFTNSKMVKVTTNQNIDRIVFYPNVNHMLIRKEGKWVKVEYKAVKA